jgi:hypothetical protein
MEKLPENIKKNGFDYKQVKRTDKAAIYAQYMTGGTLLIGYEVFQIFEQKESDTIIAGNPIHYENKELFPSDEAFGKFAWSFQSLQRAETFFEGIK